MGRVDSWDGPYLAGWPLSSTSCKPRVRIYPFDWSASGTRAMTRRGPLASPSLISVPLRVVYQTATRLPLPCCVKKRVAIAMAARARAAPASIKIVREPDDSVLEAIGWASVFAMMGVPPDYCLVVSLLCLDGEAAISL